MVFNSSSQHARLVVRDVSEVTVSHRRLNGMAYFLDNILELDVAKLMEVGLAYRRFASRTFTTTLQRTISR